MFRPDPGPTYRYVSAFSAEFCVDNVENNNANPHRPIQRKERGFSC